MKKLIIIILLIFLYSCTPKTININQQAFFAFSTTVTITIVDNYLRDQEFNSIIENLQDLAEKYDLIFNMYNPKSEIIGLKAFQANRYYKISRELYEVLKMSQKYYYLTDRAFDVTIGKITRLYNYEKGIIPTEQELRENLAFVGMDKIKLTNSSVLLLKQDMIIDLGGIAKGYIIDRFSDYIRKQGYTNYMVNIGGDIYVSGRNRYGKKWVVGIQDPEKKKPYVKTISISDQAIVTSGDYERYIQRREKKYHHILNPATGLPVWNDIVSVTVIADTAVEADYIATAMFVMGKERSKKFIDKHYKNKVEYYIITQDDIGK